MQNFWTVFRQSLQNMLGKPLWLLTVLSVVQIAVAVAVGRVPGRPGAAAGGA